MAIKSQAEMDIEVYSKIDQMIKRAESREDYRSAELWIKRREQYASAGWNTKKSLYPVIRNAK